jgi:hypothetical protein
LNLPVPIRHLYNAGDAAQRSVVLCEGIPDTLSVLVAGLKDTGACGLYGTGGWQSAWLALFRRAARVYVALDRDATDRAISIARTFGTRGRVVIPPADLGPKGDLNDWLQIGAQGDPAAFRSILERALATSPTPWAISDPAVALRPGTVGSGGPCRRARSSMRTRPSGTAQPRCAPATPGGAIWGGPCYSRGSGPRTSPERGDRAIGCSAMVHSVDQCNHDRQFRQTILPCEQFPAENREASTYYYRSGKD